MWRAVAVAMAGALVVGACSDDPDDAVDPAQAGDPDLVAPAGFDCSEGWLGEDDTVDIITALPVVGGQLGAPCLEDGRPSLERAWSLLSQIVPRQDLQDLVVFVGFEDVSGSEEGTLAFVNVYDDEGEEFQLSVNLDETGNRDELVVTLVHEFSHVLTATSDQLDRFVDPQDCDTWFNGEGCYTADAIMVAWLDAFWGDLLDEVDASQEASADLGDERCAREPRFLGPYAASSPEEDFAEAFAAWVLQVPAADAAQEASNDFFDGRPELTIYQERAELAGLAPLSYEFEVCGI